jgi:hypothetical protein
MNIELEIRVINTFIVKEKQARYIEFISSTRTRNKFIDKLSHFGDLQWDLFEEISNDDEILNRLKSLKPRIKDCYIISEDSKIDQNIFPVHEAIKRIGGYRDHATILVFGNAELVYFEGEPPHNRYISKIK